MLSTNATSGRCPAHIRLLHLWAGVSSDVFQLLCLPRLCPAPGKAASSQPSSACSGKNSAISVMVRLLLQELLNNFDVQ